MRCILISFYRCLIIFSVSYILPGTTFNLPNPLGPYAYSRQAGLFFVGSSQSSTGDNAPYALAVAGRASSTFTGIAFQTVYNNNVEQINPLYGAQINLLSTTGRFGLNSESQHDAFPVLTLSYDPNHVYVVTSYSQTAQPSLVISSSVLDANGDPASSIDALIGSIQGEIFAVASPREGSFGDIGTGVAGAYLITTQTGSTELIFQPAMPLDRTSGLVALGSPLVSLTSPSLYVSTYRNRYGISDIYLGTLFLGMKAQGAAGSNDGCYGVVSSVGSVGGPIALSTIVTASAVTADSIVAAIGPNSLVTIYFLSTLFPSVGTEYLVVVGGVGSQNATPLNVYALPLTFSGSLASINSLPQIMQDNNIFIQREFITPASKPGDLYTSSSTQARVGGGSAPGIITSLYTSGDSVIITVADSSTQAGGTYYSQAIFNLTPSIIAWTPWQRAVGTVGAVAAAVYDKYTPQFWYTTALSSDIQTVVRTEWQNNIAPLAQLLNASLPQEEGGIQGITDIITTASLFSQNSGSRTSAALFTGFKTVVLAETAADSGTMFTPVTTYPFMQTIDNGTLKMLTPPVSYIAMSGGALSSLGAIIASTVVTDGVQSWIVVGGNGGLAVLALPDGSGIPNGSISQDFTGLSPNLIWQAIGTYSNVRKLVSQNGFLYVLTDTLFERIALDASAISDPNFFVTVNLATASTLPNKQYLFFSDVIVSDPLVVLATSSGLLRGGNGVSVQEASSQQVMDWTMVDMAEYAGSATRLWAITQTGNETDLYQDQPAASGNLYVLAGNVSLDSALIYRYVITADPGGINNQSIQPFNDYYIIGKPTYLSNIGYYRNFFYTDGLLWSASRSRYLATPLFVQSLSAVIKIGSRERIANNQGFFTDTFAHSIGQVKRLSGLGSWVIPGDFGLVVHS